MIAICTCCHVYQRVQPAMGDWLRTCVVCGQQAALCDDGELGAVLAKLDSLEKCPHVDQPEPLTL